MLRRTPLRLLPSLVALLAGFAAAQPPAPLQRTRAVWFDKGENPVAAEVGLSFGPLPWDRTTTDSWDGPAGARLPLGQLAAAELATFTELQFGKTIVKPGAWTCVLERSESGWQLGLLDPAKVRALQAPPGPALGVPLLAALPLTESRGEHGPLRAAFEADGDGRIALVLRWGERVLRGGFAVKGSAGIAPHLQADPRHAQRHLFARGPDGRELVAVLDHGTVPWTAALQQQADALRPGQRWRLGRDWPTTIDTNTTVAIGGKKLPAGSWHLVVERTRDGWALIVANAGDDHRARLDGFAAEARKPVLTVPLKPYATPLPIDELRVAIDPADGQTRIVVTFGKTQVATTIAVAKG